MQQKYVDIYMLYLWENGAVCFYTETEIPFFRGGGGQWPKNKQICRQMIICSKYETSQYAENKQQ